MIYIQCNTNRPYLSRSITYAEGAGAEGSVVMVFGLRPKGCNISPCSQYFLMKHWKSDMVFLEIINCDQLYFVMNIDVITIAITYPPAGQ